MLKMNITKEELHHLYIDKGISALNIGKMFGFKSETPVCRLLKEYGIIKSKEDRIEQAKIQRAKTNIERYGVEYCIHNEEMREKQKRTCLERYGVENPSYNQTIKDKIGLKNSLNAKERMRKTKLTNLKKYGVESYTQTEEYRKKAKKTNIEKYGVECPFQRKDVIKITHSKEIIDKQMKTKRLNKTFNSSKIEDKIYNLLYQRFPLTKRQYKCDRYPFACDFYIPEIDTYIEYQGFWTHGREPYIGTSEQQEKIKLWESKNTPQYDKAIVDWTEKDVLKRETAKQNHLNWLEFFNVKQFEEWFNNL